MLDLTVTYPGRVTTGDAAYPYGKAKNRVTQGDATGTPWEAQVVNDFLGFFQAMLVRSGQVPSGNPESASTSQLADAIDAIKLNALRANLAYQRTITGLPGAATAGWLSYVPRYGTHGVFLPGSSAEYIVGASTMANSAAPPNPTSGSPIEAFSAVNTSTGYRVAMGRITSASTTGGRLLVSSAGGSWTSVSGLGSDTVMVYPINTTVGVPQFVLLDGTQTWKITNSSLLPGSTTGIVCNLGASNGVITVAAARGTTSMRVSDDFADSWSNVTLSATLQALTYFPRIRKFVGVGNSGSNAPKNGFTVLLSDDGGTWSNAQEFLRAHPNIESSTIAVDVKHLTTMAGGQMLIAAAEGSAGSEEWANHRSLWYTFDAQTWTCFDLSVGGPSVRTLSGGDSSLAVLYADGSMKLWGQL